jgi:hypothetical protein
VGRGGRGVAAADAAAADAANGVVAKVDIADVYADADADADAVAVAVAVAVGTVWLVGVAASRGRVGYPAPKRSTLQCRDDSLT